MRPAKAIMRVCKAPSEVFFAGSLGRKDSVYKSAVLRALESDSSIEVMADDKYLQSQLKTAAKALNIRLVFGTHADKLYIKPVRPSDAEKRLVLLLREPRTQNELLGAKLELDLNSTLAKMRSDGTAHVHRDKWVLTEKGLDLIEKAKHFGAVVSQA